MRGEIETQLNKVAFGKRNARKLLFWGIGLGTRTRGIGSGRSLKYPGYGKGVFVGS